MDTYLIIIGLTYFVIGLGVTIVFHYLLHRRFLGQFWGGLAVGLIGSFLGGTLDFLVFDLDLVPIAGTVDLVPPVVTSVVLVWIFSLISQPG